MTGATSSELHSARLTLRRLQPTDGETICAYRALPEVAQFQSWTTFTPADVAKLIDEQVNLEPETSGTWLQLAIVESNANALIGDCGIHFCANAPRQAEVGITLAPARQRQGLAIEAMKCVLGYLSTICTSIAYSPLQTRRTRRRRACFGVSVFVGKDTLSSMSGSREPMAANFSLHCFTANGKVTEGELGGIALTAKAALGLAKAGTGLGIRG